MRHTAVDPTVEVPAVYNLTDFVVKKGKVRVKVQAYYSVLQNQLGFILASRVLNSDEWAQHEPPLEELLDTIYDAHHSLAMLPTVGAVDDALKLRHMFVATANDSCVIGVLMVLVVCSIVLRIRGTYKRKAMQWMAREQDPSKKLSEALIDKWLDNFLRSFRHVSCSLAKKVLSGVVVGCCCAEQMFNRTCFTSSSASGIKCGFTIPTTRW